MAKKQRKYGDAWKDVQIDAEQNDAVFDRFFKRTSPPPSSTEIEEEKPRSENLFDAPPQTEMVSQDAVQTGSKRVKSKATVEKITPVKIAHVTAPPISRSSNALNQVEAVRQQYRLSKGESAILKHLLLLAQEAGLTECYTKIPLLADACNMTHRGCQFALKNLQSRGLILKIQDYDPANRLGIKFKINLPLG